MYAVSDIHAWVLPDNAEAWHILEHAGYERMEEAGAKYHYVHHRIETTSDESYHPEGMKVLYLAGGCFWGTEKVFQQLDGVKDTTVGYANGHLAKPTYEQVCRNTTGYKETVRVTYDPAITPSETILKAYFLCIDPTVKDQQGNDIGSQYQTGVYYRDPSLKPLLERIFAQERKKHARFYVECEPLSSFYEAEEYHQDYLLKNPQGYCHITPVELAQVQALNRQKK